MRNEAVFIKGKRKYIFCGDEQGLKLLSSIIEKVKKEELANEWFLLSNHHKLSLLEEFLKSQKMGTFLYVALPYSVLQQVRVIAENIGYSDEDLQFIGHGEWVANVFCCRCHDINKAKKDQTKLVCPRCGLELSVSDHYSELHQAFLGYVAKL